MFNENERSSAANPIKKVQSKSLLTDKAKREHDIGEGVFEIQQDGYGFLRVSDNSTQLSPNNIYVCPAQIRKYNLRTGDTIVGKIRAPKGGEIYFALLEVIKN